MENCMKTSEKQAFSALGRLPRHGGPLGQLLRGLGETQRLRREAFARGRRRGSEGVEAPCGAAHGASAVEPSGASGALRRATWSRRDLELLYDCYKYLYILIV